MTIKHLTPILLGMILSGGLLTAAAAAQPTTSSSQNFQIEHLTCARNPQGLMCNIDDSSNINIERLAISPQDSFTPAAVTNEQLAQISDLLLGIIYLGLPTVIIFAVIRHDRRAAQHTQLVAQLERIWENSPA